MLPLLLHPILLRISLLTAAVSIWLRRITQTVPEPYLDEVFHVPQARAYCADRFDIWDPKLTTPAGLYLLTYPLHHLSLCTTPYLRGANALGVAVLLPVIVYRIHQQLYGRSDAQSGVAAQTAMNVALFPLLFFFSGLYYTDVYSTVFVLAAYLALLKRRPWVCAVYCWVALWFRQTNVLWAAFMAGVWAVGKVEELQGPREVAVRRGEKRRHVEDDEDEDEDEDKDEEEEEMSAQEVWALLARPKEWRKIRTYNPTFSEETTWNDLLLTPLSMLPPALFHLPALLLSLLPFLAVLASFVLFLASNGWTIVLGDKAAHTATLHTPQLLYLAIFVCAMSFPHLLTAETILSFLRTFSPVYLERHSSPSPSSSSSSSSASSSPASSRLRLRLAPLNLLKTPLYLLPLAAAVHYNTHLHPYLLADNRHYVFYLFRRTLLLSPPLSFFLPLPLYLASLFFALSAFRDRVSVAWVLLWALATAGTIVGAGLVEFRYFIVPWVLWRVHVVGTRVEGRQGGGEGGEGSCGEWARLAAEMAWFVAVNGATGYVFLNWGFEWQSESGKVQRFMW